MKPTTERVRRILASGLEPSEKLIAVHMVVDGADPTPEALGLSSKTISRHVCAAEAWLANDRAPTRPRESSVGAHERFMNFQEQDLRAVKAGFRPLRRC
jgi:hypothetical protein